MKNYSLSLSDRLNEYRSILTHRWRSILLVALLLAAALCLVVQLIPDSYQASTTILAFPRKVPERYVAATVIDEPADRLALLQQEILSSSRLLQVINKFGLYRTLIASDGRDAALREIRRQIKIQTSHGTSSGPSAFTLTFNANDPQTAAAVANELANSFIVKNLSNREQQVVGTTSFINDQLNQARQDLQKQEDQLRVFRMKHLGEMPDQATANLQAISQIEAQYRSLSDKLAELDQEKSLIENTPDRDPALRMGNSPSPASVLEVELSQERAHLADLQTHVTAEHPDVVASKSKIKELENQLARLPKSPVTPTMTRGADARLRLIEEQRDHLLSEQAALTTRLDAYQGKVDAVPLRQEELSGLTRDYDTSREHYRSLLEKYYSAEMASELEEKQDAERFEVLDSAVPPERPTSPNRPLLWTAACAAAFIGSFMLAFGLEQIDGSIKSEADLCKILPAGLQFAGMVSNIAPAVKSNQRRIFDPV